MNEEILNRNTEVITKSERVSALRQELSELESAPSNFDPRSLMQIIQNPASLTKYMSLSDKQALNAASFLTGGGAGAFRKVMTQYLGAELSGAIGGFISGYISKKMFGV